MDLKKVLNDIEAKHSQLLMVALGIGLVLRLLWALLIPVDPVSDSYAYWVLAQSVADGKGYAWADGTLTAYWPPGTSFIYAALFYLFGDGYASILVLHLIAGMLVVYLGYRLTCQVFDRSVGLLVALLLAIWPMLIQFTTILASEVLFIVPVLFASVLVFERRDRKFIHFVLFGASLAVAAYIRPTALPLLVLLPIAYAIRFADIRSIWGWVLIGGLCCALLVSPWSYRNTKLFGEFTTISTNFGANFWMGNNPTSNGGYQSIDAYAAETNEKRRDDRLRREAISFIQENPMAFLRLGVRRMLLTFDRESIGVVWNEKGIQSRFGESRSTLLVLKLISAAYWYAVLLLAVAGGVLLLVHQKWRVLGNPLFLMAALFAAIPAIMVGQDRYHMPMIPMLAAFAAYAIVHGMRRRVAAVAA